MEPIGSLDSVQHPLLHVCAGFRHFDVETVFYIPGPSPSTPGLLAFVEALILLQFLCLPLSRMAQGLGMVVNPNAMTQTLLGSAKERIINPIERPSVTQELSENVILTTVDDLYLVTAFKPVATLSELPC